MATVHGNEIDNPLTVPSHSAQQTVDSNLIDTEYLTEHDRLSTTSSGSSSERSHSSGARIDPHGPNLSHITQVNQSGRVLSVDLTGSDTLSGPDPTIPVEAMLNVLQQSGNSMDRFEQVTKFAKTYADNSQRCLSDND
ncbi:unnamed protein product [Echinostoma caproni]|uniref:Fork-head domain-containing protein n=1 Tax=Echinostoma caproni TaxID=27848 RepID=A0A183B7S9_9TREM|nr:unnamed protein product [Echinostoma caproni]